MRAMTFVTGMGVIALGATLLAQSVNYDFDRAADFSKFKTYAWVRGTPVNDALNDKRIVRAINNQLASKRLVMAPNVEAADVLVAYHATFDKNLQINGFSSGFGPYRFGGMRTGTARVDEIVIGTLAVDIVDAKTNTIVWRGQATKEIDVKANPEKREKNINRAAEKLFKNYPPK